MTAHSGLPHPVQLPAWDLCSVPLGLIILNGGHSSLLTGRSDAPPC